MTDAEKTLRAFYKSCFQAGRDDCKLARQDDQSWRDIEARMDEFLERIYREPLAAWDAKRPGLITSGYVRRESPIMTESPRPFMSTRGVLI